VRSTATGAKRGEGVEPCLLGILDKLRKHLTAVFAGLVQLSTIIGPLFIAVLQLPFTLLLSSGHVIGVLLVRLLFSGFIFQETARKSSNCGDQEIQELTNLLCLGPEI
uniref:hypothetical protein n=1 Tax=Escherichia coli TaxID=562 RepID=UPI0013B3CCB9